MIKLNKLLIKLVGKSDMSFYQIYEYEEVKFKIKFSLLQAISSLYYNPSKYDNKDYILQSLSYFKECQAYINNAHKHYGILNKI